MQIRAPEAPGEALRLRCPPLASGALHFRRLRVAERAVWPVGRVGAATSRAWILLRPGPILIGGLGDC
eukprot:14353287-Alexandrium_andersonii.AAC.1